MLQSIQEEWDLYEENGNIIPNKVHIRGDEIPNGAYHLVVNVMMRGSDGKYLLSQRSASKESFPLLWEGAGGSVLRHENSLEAAIREASEELGIDLCPDCGRLIDVRVRKTVRGKPYNDILHTWLFEQELDYSLDRATTRDEVANAGLFTLSEMKQLFEEQKMVPDLEYILDLLED